MASRRDIDMSTPVMKVTNKPAHIREYIEGSIERLGSAPDLYYLHRIDPGTL
jgi:aryl-alcohol dehydrogenase-like predicted oxidoreductase